MANFLISLLAIFCILQFVASTPDVSSSASDEEAPAPKPSCSTACGSKHKKQVCGSDGKIYESKCLLRCAKKKNPGLKKVKLSKCDGADSPAKPQGRTYYNSGRYPNQYHGNDGHNDGYYNNGHYNDYHDNNNHYHHYD